MADDVSEFTEASGSVISRRSNFSNYSATSNSSFNTDVSKISSNTSHSTKSSFSVRGIDHSLLSRGGLEGDHIHDLQFKGQKQHKRKQRSRNKGDGQDIWGLKKEGKLSSQLWALGDLQTLAISASNTCRALISRDMEYVNRFQKFHNGDNESSRNSISWWENIALGQEYWVTNRIPYLIG